MTLRKIYVAPHPVLKTKADPVLAVDGKTRALMDDMLDTMYGNDGIGLAAPQVGVSLRIVVLDVDQPRGENLSPAEKRGRPQFFVNPEIVSVSDEVRVYNEGCLSIPGQYAEIERPDRLRQRVFRARLRRIVLDVRLLLDLVDGLLGAFGQRAIALDLIAVDRGFDGLLRIFGRGRRTDDGVSADAIF